MPSAAQSRRSVSAYASSPKTVRKVTFSPSRRRLCAMLRPTPPGVSCRVPGFESRKISFFSGRPQMSIFTAPTTATYRRALI